MLFQSCFLEPLSILVVLILDSVLHAATTRDAQKATVVPKLKDHLDEIRDIMNATATEAAKAAEAAAWGGGEPPLITIVGALHNPQCKIGVSTSLQQA